MPEPVRVRITEIIYQCGCNTQNSVRGGPNADAYRVKDTVSISNEAFKKFKASGRQNNQPVTTQGEQQTKSQQDRKLTKDFEALELAPGARAEEIRKAYREAVKKYHPDKFLNQPPELAKAAEEKTKRINSAYSILRKA
jgi:DnaJ-domain-containing protein 1